MNDEHDIGRTWAVRAGSRGRWVGQRNDYGRHLVDRHQAERFETRADARKAARETPESLAPRVASFRFRKINARRAVVTPPPKGETTC